jgi:hypothetical protein
MIWPFDLFKTKPKEPVKLPQLAEIRFGSSDGSWAYTPVEDITPHEVALLVPMFIHPFWRADYQGYIDKHNLRRHFTKTEK